MCRLGFNNPKILVLVSLGQDQPSSGEQFVAIHRGVSLGDREVLEPNLLGLTNMAMRFLPKHLKLLNVVSATREIVAGVRFELVVNALEGSERTVCALDILEKPWVVNEWGEKSRVLRNTNCTGEGVVLNAEEPNQKVNPLFALQQPQTLTPERMRELENQIVTNNRRKVESHTFGPTSSTTEAPGNHVTGLDDSMKAALDKFFSFASPNDVVKPPVNQEPVSQEPATQEPVIKPPVNQEPVHQEQVPKVIESPPCSEKPALTEPTQSPNLNSFYYNSNGNSNTPPPEIVALSQSEDANTQQQVMDPFFDPQTIQSNRRRREISFTEAEKEHYLSLSNMAMNQIDRLDKDDEKRVAYKLVHVKELSSDFNCKTLLVKVMTANSDCEETVDDFKVCLDKLKLSDSVKLCRLEVKIGLLLVMHCIVCCSWLANV